jgi:Cys-tRNA(Pro)/Cys-tRNA(Cys) deacylase
MSKVTHATKMLEQAGIAFTVHSYNYDPFARWKLFEPARS